MQNQQNTLEAEYESSRENTIVGNMGHYRLRRNKFLGRGGFGIVYVAIRKQKVNGRLSYDEVVLKQYKKSEKWLNEEDFDKELVVFQRFKDVWDYQYLLKIHDIFQEKDTKRHYLVLEYAAEGTLFDRIKEPMKEEDVFQFVKRSAQILHYLHYQALKSYRSKSGEQKQDALSFIHRDFKPANLVYKDKNNQSSMYLIDFGIAKIGYANLPKTFNNSGTNNYKAPEIYENRIYNAKVDVYSFGCTLYEVLTAGDKLLGAVGMAKRFEDREKYVRGKLMDLQYRFSRGQKQRRIEYPSFWLQILYNCLVHNPKERWSSQQLLEFVEQKDRKSFKSGKRSQFEEEVLQVQLRERREIYEINFEIYRLNLIQERIFAIFEHLYFRQPRISKFTLYGILKYVIMFELEKFRKTKDKCKLAKREDKLRLVNKLFEKKKLEDIKKKALEKMVIELDKEKEANAGEIPYEPGHIEEMIDRYPELLNETAPEPRRNLYEFCYQERNNILEDDIFAKMVALILIFMDDIDWYPELTIELEQFKKCEPEIESLKRLSKLRPGLEARMDEKGVREVYDGCHIEQTLKDGLNKEQLKTDIEIELK